MLINVGVKAQESINTSKKIINNSTGGSMGVKPHESINASGNNAVGSGGSLSYSIGQVFYTTNTGDSGSEAQGVQQLYIISITTSTTEAKGMNLSVFPNPINDYLILEVNASTMLSSQSMSFQLVDINGKILQNGKITNYKTSFNMSNFVPATYFLKVTHDSNEIKAFKIIKK